MDKDSKKGINEVEEFAAKIADKQDNPTIHELAKEFPEKTYKELERYRDEDRQQEAGTCMVGEMRKDREDTSTKMEDIKRLELEVEGLKQQLHTDRGEFQSNLDKVKKENNELFNRIAELTEIDGSHQRLNGKLQVRIAELEDENKKVHNDLDKKLDSARKAGM